MADEDDIEDEDEEGGKADSEDGDGEGAPKKKGKRKLLIIVGLVFLLVFGGLAGAYFTGLLDPLLAMVLGEPEHEEGSAEEAMPSGGVYYELPELLVNLNTTGRKSSFLKIRISLEIDVPEDIPRIEQVMPRIIDNFQVYLRELRIEDLQGAAGMYRLREELLTRVSAAAAPIRVKDVLFREMLIQ